MSFRVTHAAPLAPSSPRALAWSLHDVLSVGAPPGDSDPKQIPPTRSGVRGKLERMGRDTDLQKIIPEYVGNWPEEHKKDWKLIAKAINLNAASIKHADESLKTNVELALFIFLKYKTQYQQNKKAPWDWFDESVFADAKFKNELGKLGMNA